MVHNYFDSLGLVTRGSPEAWAAFSPDDVYRYALCRMWDDLRATLVVCALNPSTATHEETDPTLSKLCHYARRDGFGSLLLVNVAAWRATDPRALLAVQRQGLDPVGEHNRDVIRWAMDAPLLAKAVAAWGSPKWKAVRPWIAKARMNGSRRDWHCFGVTKDGHPRHPLYLRNDEPIRPWTLAEVQRAAA